MAVRLGEEELQATKKALGWPHHGQVLSCRRRRRSLPRSSRPRRRGAAEPGSAKFEAYKKAISRQKPPSSSGCVSGKLPDELGRGPSEMEAGRQAHRRRASPAAQVLNALAKRIPNIDGRVGRSESFHRIRR